MQGTLPRYSQRLAYKCVRSFRHLRGIGYACPVNWRSDREFQVGESRFEVRHSLKVGEVDIDHRHLAIEEIKEVGAVIFVSDHGRAHSGLSLGLPQLLINARNPFPGPT